MTQAALIHRFEPNTDLSYFGQIPNRTLHRRARYGGRKGRRAVARLRDRSRPIKKRIREHLERLMAAAYDVVGLSKKNT